MKFHAKLVNQGAFVSKFRRLIPVVFGICMFFSIRRAVPFDLFMDFWGYLLSFATIILGCLVSFFSGRRPIAVRFDKRLSFFETIRYPVYSSKTLIFGGLVLFSGVRDLIPIYIGIAIIVVERLIIFEEERLYRMYGEQFEHFSARTSSLLPRAKFTQSRSIVDDFWMKVKLESRMWLVVSLSLLCIDSYKMKMVSFDFKVSPVLLILTVFMGVIWAMSHYRKNKA